MLSRMHQKLGTAGFVVAIVALVAALTGAAFAAGGLTKQQEKQVKKIAKKYAGKRGKQGPAGPQGPVGPQGPKGNPGSNGTNGTDGTNGTNGTDGEDGMCTAGNPACELPSGAELVGAWSTSGGLGKEEHRDISLTPISFNVRVSPAPTALWAFQNGPFTFGLELSDGSVKIFGPNPNPATLPQAEEDQEAWEEACPGTADNPEAAAGFLCIYNTEIEGATGPSFSTQGLAEAANEYGITVPWKVGDEEYARGSWAVKAE